jgi:hypothetical protein
VTIWESRLLYVFAFAISIYLQQESFAFDINDVTVGGGDIFDQATMRARASFD